VFTAVTAALEADSDELKLYTDLLYKQAFLMEGLPIENPVGFSKNVCILMK